MHDAVVSGGPKHWLARWGNKVLQRQTASAFLLVAVVEIAGENRKPNSVAVVVRHCTLDPDYNSERFVAVFGLVGTRVDTELGLKTLLQMKVLSQGNTQNIPWWLLL